jgi:hypothetical protein
MTDGILIAERYEPRNVPKEEWGIDVYRIMKGRELFWWEKWFTKRRKSEGTIFLRSLAYRDLENEVDLHLSLHLFKPRHKLLPNKHFTT